MMSRITKSVAACMAVIGLLAATGCQSDNGARGEANAKGGETSGENLSAQLRLATLSQGSSWHVYGGVLSDQWAEDHPGIQTQVLPFAGGVANLDLIAEGEAGLGLTFNNIAAWAHEGTFGFEQQTNFSAVMGGFDNYYVGIVARDDLPIDTLSDIREEEFPLDLYVLNPGSAGEYMAQATLEAHGLSYEDIESYGGSVQQTSFDVITDAFDDGVADMMIQVITADHPATTEIATSNNVKLIPVEEEIHQEMADQGVSYDEIPANSYPGQTEAVPALGLTTLLVAHNDQPDDLIYGITESIVENADEFGEQTAALSEFDPERGVQEESVPIPFHPGAESYLQDAGLLD